LIGGGGKTGLMVYLLDELEKAGKKVIASTTTKLSADYPRGLSFRVADSLSAVLKQVVKPHSPGERVTLVQGEAENETGKMAGIHSDWIDKASAAHPDIIFLVEGDGSAGRSLKGHLTHEPVIPAATGLLIPVIGIDCIGKALDDESAHRPSRITELTGTEPGAIITGELIIQLLFHPEGYLRNCPTDAVVLPFIIPRISPLQFRKWKGF